MEQFRHIGEVLGSLKALMVLRDEIQINQRQCCLILDIFTMAFDTICEEIRQNLVLEERNTKWKPLEYPLRELSRVFREGELYIKQCLDCNKDWWGKAITLSHNTDCVEFHIHNLLSYFPAVIEAIENAGEVSGNDEDEMKKKRVMLGRKYDKEWNDPELFQWRFGKQYLVPREISKQLENAWREDRWRLIESLKQKMMKKKSSKNEQLFADLLIDKLLKVDDNKLFPSWILMGAKDYQVRRRLGRGSEYKEIQWLGQSFALRQTQMLEAEICTLLSLSHPNILQYLCGFYDEDKPEFFLVMELMSKDLDSYMKENYGPRRQILFTIPVVVDLMLQIARGMEYLHSRNMYHGNLNPCNIMLKARNSQEGYFQVKVAGFGGFMDQQEETNPSHIWLAPEVLTELEQKGKNNALCKSNARYSEKADVYSFGMICFELLTGKVPFEDIYRNGDGSNRNIKAGERPLFPYPSPKYLVSLIKKCWQTDPNLRPSFSSICRILRSIKKFLAINTECFVINPELNLLELTCPPVDYCEIEALFLKNFPMEKTSRSPSVSQIPYEMFAYKTAEKEKTSQTNGKDKSCESEKDVSPKSEPIASAYEEENDNDNNKKVFGEYSASTVDDPFLQAMADTNSSCSELLSVCSQASTKKSVRIQLSTEERTRNYQVTSKLRAPNSTARASKTIKGNQLESASSSGRRRTSQVMLDSKNQSPSVPIRRKRQGHVPDVTKKSILKTKIGNESPSPKTSTTSQSKKGYMSPLRRHSRQTLDSKNTSKINTKGNNNQSPLKTRGSAINMSPYANATSPFSSCSRRSCGHNNNNNNVSGRISPFALSPLAPYVRAYVSNSMGKVKRASLSPLASRPLSPYVRVTNGHVSD
ncbi:putative serine/threonine-protein kinase [Senna tora]|uniref:Putative serine/threonine-protein kinase n=1 Tax=Senna tora TaxID=362788 RepID=A0A834TTY7_9FABA|nr:putative serine/threonine-protein kinase [Senna tora]